MAKNNNGFFLLELVIVLALIAMIVSMTFMNSQLLTEQNLKGHLQNIYAAIMYTHRAALATGMPQTITFDIQHNRYYVGDTPYELSRDIAFDFLPGTKGPPATPVHAITKAITFVDLKLTAHPDGTVQAGTIYLTDKNKKYMYALTVPAGHVSFIRCYEFNTTWKKLE